MRKILLSTILVLLAHPAFAIDCTAAKSSVEKAICSDPEARSADQALGEAFTRLRNSLTGEKAAGLRQSQIEWIRVRDRACADPAATKSLSKCVAEQSRERQRLLEGRPLAGDTSASLSRPIFMYRPAKNGAASLSVRSIEFIGNGAWQVRANAMIESEVKRAIEDAEAAKDNPGNQADYYVHLDIDLAYASSRMVSVHVGSDDYVGQAHPNSGSYNITFDTATGRELTFNDLLDEAKAKPNFEFCRAEVAKQKKERADDPEHWKDDVGLKETIEATKNFSSWRFNASSVDVDYGAYGFGGYGQCMCSARSRMGCFGRLRRKNFRCRSNTNTQVLSCHRPAPTGRSSIPRRQRWNREAAAYLDRPIKSGDDSSLWSVAHRGGHGARCAFAHPAG